MSNLKLPTMTFAALESNNEVPLDGRLANLAYATQVAYTERDAATDAYFTIYHHGTRIAEIARGWVWVINAGYTSQTTRDRIHKILADNRQDYGFLTLRQSKGEQVLSFRASGAFTSETTPIEKDRELTRSFYSAHWDFENRIVDMTRSFYSTHWDFENRIVDMMHAGIKHTITL